MSLKEMFEAENDEFLKFDRIEKPRHPVPDVCAFLMLHDLAPAYYGSGYVRRIVGAAEHDEIYLATDCDALEKVATPGIVRDLTRCGIRYGDDGLCMFV